MEAPQPTRVFIDYAGIPACPDLAWFKRQLSARTNRAVFGEGKADSGDVAARIRFEDQGRRGILELDAGAPTTRAVVGRDCIEVSDGMALIVAMAVDPKLSAETSGATPLASGAGAPSQLDPGAAPVSAPPVADAAWPTEPATAAEPTQLDGGAGEEGVRTIPSSRALTSRRGRKPLTPAPATSPARDRESEPNSSGALVSGASAARPRWSAALGFGGVVGTGWGAGAGLGLLGWASVERELTKPWTIAALVSYEVDRQREIDTLGGAAEFSRYLARLGVCPVRWEPGDRSAVIPCALFELGRVEGVGHGVVGAREARAEWYGVALLLRGELRPVDRLVVALDGLTSIPLTHDRFVLAPDTEVVRYPWVAFGSALSVALAL